MRQEKTIATAMLAFIKLSTACRGREPMQPKYEPQMNVVFDSMRRAS